MKDMTYVGFHIVFLLLPSLGLYLYARKLAQQGSKDDFGLNRHLCGTAILAGIAFAWTTPWDNYLIASGVWDSPQTKILGRMGYVPLEEYAFFLLMPLFNSLLLYPVLLKLRPQREMGRLPQARSMRIAFSVIGLLLFALGIIACWQEPGRYLGLTLLWFVPPLMVQWLYDPSALVQSRNALALGTLLPTLYFSCADALAIHQGIWIISPEYTTGLSVGNLPIEEIVFFFTTSLLITQGLILWHRLERRP